MTLAPSDYERLVPWEAQLTNSLAELVQEHLDENGWRTIGDIEVYLARDEALHTGVFGVASRMESNAPPRRRPYDSLSLPVVPGLPPVRTRRHRATAGCRRRLPRCPAAEPGPRRADARDATARSTQPACRPDRRSAPPNAYAAAAAGPPPHRRRAAPRVGAPSSSTAPTSASSCAAAAT